MESGGTREAVLHTGAELAGHAILSRVDGQLDALFPAMILRVEVAAATHAGRARGLLPTALGLPCETFFLAPRPFALTKGRSPFELLLTASSAVAAGRAVRRPSAMNRHCTQRASSRARSWEISRPTPLKGARAAVIASRVGVSTWLVGSSITSRSDAARARKLPAAAFAGHRTRCRSATASRLPRLNHGEGPRRRGRRQRTFHLPTDPSRPEPAIPPFRQESSRTKTRFSSC